MHEKRKLSCDRSKVSQFMYKCTRFRHIRPTARPHSNNTHGCTRTRTRITHIAAAKKTPVERFSHVLAKEQLSLEIEGVPEATAQMVLNALLPFIQSSPGYNRRTGGRKFLATVMGYRTDG
jgi:hypothetical protein